MMTSRKILSFIAGLVALVALPAVQAQSVTLKRAEFFTQTGASTLTNPFNPVRMEVHVRGGNIDMSAWGPRLYLPGSGGVPQSGTSNDTNTLTLNFPSSPNNGSDYMFIHRFASRSALLSAYPLGQYGITFMGNVPPSPSTFTAGLSYSIGDFPAAPPSIASANNGATWNNGLILRETGLTNIALSSFPEYATATHGALISVGLFDDQNRTIPDGSTGAYRAPGVGVNQAAITNITIDGSKLEPGRNYLLELQYGIFSSALANGTLNSASFTGSAGYYRITRVSVGVNPYQPVITSAPGDRAVPSGGRAVFNVAARGGLLQYQWRKNGVNLTDGPNVSGATTTELVVTGIQAAQTGTYDVVITNPAGTTISAPVTLRLITAYNDFNRDNSSDLIWQNTSTGQRALWLLNGTTPMSSANLVNIATEWDLAGAADFNQDGSPDLIWQNTTTGQRALWMMDNTTPISSANLLTIGTEWDLVGAADFNQDGPPDLIWQNKTTGQRAIWLMNGTVPVSSANLLTIATEWDLVGAADFNRDNHPDLIWQNTTTGQRAIWVMNGTVPVSSANLVTIPTAWDLVGAVDFNGDRYPDLIWQNKVTGERALWLMNGTTPVSSQPLITIPVEWDLVR